MFRRIIVVAILGSLGMAGCKTSSKKSEDNAVKATSSAIIGEKTQIKAIRNTYFKISSQDSTELNAEDVCMVSSGEVYEATIKKIEGSHLQIDIIDLDCSFKEGYIYIPHFDTNAKSASGNTIALCQDDTVNKCGPFSDEMVAECKRLGGGRACESNRWSLAIYNSAKQNLSTEDISLSGTTFSQYYANNYGYIKKVARKFWSKPYGCAAYASSALKLAGFSIKQVLVTNDVESQLKKLGWTRITKMSQLAAGDVVFTDKATSNIAGTYSHVYVFHRYSNSAKTSAIISDNNGTRITRNVYRGNRSRSVVAYRAPK
ncbi:MAG: hypothetical protein HRU19_26360 [Pseudobacteriovorax sp.]|nr:hypothetical protein [Pseudobacteriovorax sp.]